MALDKTKTNKSLGRQIHEHLLDLGIETPMCSPIYKTDDSKIELISSDMQLEKIRHSFENIMTVLGMDLTDDSLQETPMRMAKMFMHETMWGLDPENFPKCTIVKNKMKCDEMVLEKNVTISSICEHHLKDFHGFATIAYIPSEKILGLSKFSRIADYFSRRPQIQERLTAQIFHTLSYLLETENVAVAIHATHGCVHSRGVQDPASSTFTNKLGGSFKNEPMTRAEFMALLPKSV